jgi:hypothetical protein
MAEKYGSDRERTPEEIRREIEQTRSQMDGTVGSLSEKLGPRRMMHDAVESAKGGVREKVSGAAHAVKDRVTGIGGAVSDGASGAADATKRVATDTARRARDGFSTLLDENPMVLAAVSFGLGLASGLSAPGTQWENERVGAVADGMKEEAKRMGRETAEKTKAVVKETADAVKQAAQNQKETRATTDAVRDAVEQVKGSAKEVLYTAKGTAREVAEREGLTVEGLKQQVNRVKQASRPAKPPSTPV